MPARRLPPPSILPPPLQVPAATPPVLTPRQAPEGSPRPGLSAFRTMQFKALNPIAALVAAAAAAAEAFDPSILTVSFSSVVTTTASQVLVSMMEGLRSRLQLNAREGQA
ncbi:uncharacterized protein BXZ73DRAFT_100191 [Epithele typhae]|uniref:uncharacterized protein n=1 Tax=Epithele typhae TaxID=378194 RepID=UPI002007C06B|nr:uncharacterized protein BXZ73DRAFT_100191 [Epithele typhae]KAH9936769.1 hypothetical protein BXZ73DRAFT_100191 [Epithele typhae]